MFHVLLLFHFVRFDQADLNRLVAVKSVVKRVFKVKLTGIKVRLIAAVLF